MTTRRRGHGEGSIRKRPDGRWEASIELGPGEGRRRKYLYGRTRVEAVAKLRRAQASADAGLPMLDERTRLGLFLNTWLTEVVKPARANATWQGYEVNVRRHIEPVLGRVPLTKLSPANVQALLNAKRDEGLSPRTVQYVHATLRAALGVALRWGLVARNVATLVEPVTVKREPVVPFTPLEVHRLLAAAGTDRLAAFYQVAMALGLRPSEALALSWADLDLKEAVLHIRRTLERQKGGGYVFNEPKSRTSRRIIPLPGVCVEALKAHRRRQLEERLAAGAAWDDHDLVFASPVGHPLDRTEVSRCASSPALRLPPHRGVPPPRPGSRSASGHGDARSLVVRIDHEHVHPRAAGAHA